MNYKIEVLRDDAGFRVLADPWAELFSEAEDANTFLSHEWLYSWWASYRPTAQLCLIVAWQDGRLMGIAPMMCQRERVLAWPVRTLRFVGDGTAETDHMNFVVRRSQRQSTLAALLGEIDTLTWDIAYFNQMPETSANTLQTLEFARARGWNVDLQKTPCPLRHVPKSYEEMLRSLPSRFRSNLRSARRRLEGAHAVEFGLHADRQELPGALEILFKNHAGRWKMKGQQGVFIDARKRAFYAALTPQLLERGTLRFFFLKLDGRVVAQQYCFEHQGNVMVLQEGFDPTLARDNVGNVLRAMVFEHLIAAGSRVYDFLAGVSRHKQVWSDGASNDLRIDCGRQTLRGRISFLLPRWLSRVKQSVLRLLWWPPRPAPAMEAAAEAKDRE